MLASAAGRAEFVIANVGATGGTATVKLKAAVALCPEASVTWTEKGYDPESAVLPAMTPLEVCSWIPDGKTPLTRFHW
jgi:hypothetical protein